MGLVTVRDGCIFWRDFYKPEIDARALADHFASIPRSDWFYWTAQQHARDLRNALDDIKRENAHAISESTTT